MPWTTPTERVLQFDAEIFARDIGSERVVQKGDHDFYIVFSLTSRDLNGLLEPLDVSGAGTMTIVFIDPSGDKFRRTLLARSGGVDGLVQYFVAAPDLLEVGRWEMYAEIAFDTGIVTSQRSWLFVEGEDFQTPEKKNRIVDIDQLIVDGQSFSFGSFRTLANAEVLDFVFTPPGSPPDVLLTTEISVGAITVYEWFEGPTGIVGGTPLLAFDVNRQTRNTPLSILLENPTVGAPGTLLDDAELGATDDKGKEDFGATGGGGQILQVATNYLVRLTSQAAGNRINFDFTWFEDPGC